MRIIVVGGGKVGFNIAKELEKENHDITVIDNRSHVAERINNLLDVVCVEGNGADLNVLKEANVSSSDMLIAATASDEVNIISCLLATKLGVSNTIARIRNPEYNNSMALLKDDLGLSMTVNPERLTAREIVRSIRYSNAIKASTLAKGRIELAETVIGETNPMAEKTVSQVMHQYPSSVLVCLVQRGDEVIIPNGNTLIKKGDHVSIIGRTQDVEHFMIQTGISEYGDFDEIMVVGGGRITYYLTYLMDQLGVRVKIIEKNEEKCRNLALTFPNATIIHGDGTDHEFLRSENLKNMDAFIALTDNDEENVIISIYASTQGVKHIIPKVNRFSMDFLYDKFGLANAITPKQIAADAVLQYVRAMQNAVGSNVESLVSISEKGVEALEFRVRENCSFIGKPLKELTFKKGILIGYIFRGRNPEIATGDSYLQVGDTVVVVSAIPMLRDINDVLA
ncbi:MAG: Trk system potassium transporter TrkA [Erysipelotrichaceae bacterium]|nr:Trk system potassium transporter TrkA [Erysipelotrichaceae bacterium]